MVGYNPNFAKLTHTDFAFAGALSGFITRALCQPLDVVKIRFQLQVESISSSATSKYRSITHAFTTIAKEERIKSLWKGHVPAQWLSVIYGLGQFWSFEVCSKISYQHFGTRHKQISNFSCGAIAGTFATVISFPFDVVRTRLVAQSELNKIYSGVFHTFSNVLQKEGFLVLFRGLFPTVIQVAPHTGVQFMSYKFFESIYREFIPTSIEKRYNVFTSSVVCGGLAGLCAKTAIYPLDLSKKRLQIQGFDRKVFGKNFVCSGLVDCFRKTYKFEGFLGLYKGLFPSLIKAVVSTALHFSSYELICLEISKYR